MMTPTFTTEDFAALGRPRFGLRQTGQSQRDNRWRSKRSA